jgi:molybdopterin-synthase adenylyltransferase
MISRYHRQMLLPQVGAEGQERLRDSRALIVGCGALGSVIAEQLARAGIGHLRIVDRDVVELTNLQRQVLFDEDDARQGLPKAVAAAERLRRINSEVLVEAETVDVHSGNIEPLMGVVGGLERVEVVLDGTDNVETRYLINDASVKHGVPWIHGACIGTEGRVMLVRPGQTACLRCLYSVPPRGSELPTCDIAGVLGAAAGVVACLQSALAIRVLLEHEDPEPAMHVLDVWGQRFHSVNTLEAMREDCPACGRRRFDYLDAPPASGTARLCGREAVQVHPGADGAVDLEVVARRLAGVGEVETKPWFIRCRLRDGGRLMLTVFHDGRLIVQGTGDVNRARSLYARYVGL